MAGLQTMPTRWEDALYTHDRMFLSDLPCLKGHGFLRMAYRNKDKKHAPCAECHRLHSAGKSFGILPNVMTLADRSKTQPSVLCAPDNPPGVDPSYIARLKTSMRGAIDFARRRQAKLPNPAEVTLTVEQAMSLLRKQDYRCALTGRLFWSTSVVSGRAGFSPSNPSLDRLRHGGPYSLRNVRVIFTGVNGLRGSGSDADMYAVAEALVKRHRES
jgi:hypothetical protein